MSIDLQKMADEHSELLGGVFTGMATTHNRAILGLLARQVAAAIFDEVLETIHCPADTYFVYHRVSELKRELCEDSRGEAKP